MATEIKCAATQAEHDANCEECAQLRRAQAIYFGTILFMPFILAGMLLYGLWRLIDWFMNPTQPEEK